MRKKIRLGEMLVDKGMLSREQLESALEEHKRLGLKLGQYLVRFNIVREDRIVELLSQQLRIPRYSPSRYPVDLSLTGTVSAETAKRHQAVPLERRGSLLAVATTDPLDIEAMDSIELSTNLEVEPVVCTEAEFDQLYTTLYGIDSGLDQLMEDMEHVAVSSGEAGMGETLDVDVGVLEDQADQAPVVRLVNSLLAQAVKERASDIHLSPEKDKVQTRFRIDGRLREMSTPPKNLFPALVSRIKILANMDISVTRIPQDGRFTATLKNREINVRASCVPTIYGENVVLRLLDMSSEAFTLDDLGMQQDDLAKMEAALQKPYGMILSTGPTGSGKTTSLYAGLRRINRPDINIVTLEDPVEYRVEGLRQVQLNRRAGMTFASGLRSILRQDPDVIMVGEIRDSETAKTAVQAAMTGHRMFSTVHTNDAAGAITRLIDMGVEPFLVSSVLLVSFAQRLMRKVCPNCAEEYAPPRGALRALGLESSSGCTFVRGQGCSMCMNTGYRGRTAVFEVLDIDDWIQDMIARGLQAKEIGRYAAQAGKLTTLRHDAARKVCQGLTTAEEAVSVVMS